MQSLKKNRPRETVKPDAKSLELTSDLITRRAMDAVLKEFKIIKTSDYETDSLEKADFIDSSTSNSPLTSIDKSNPNSLSALPEAEELTMNNDVVIERQEIVVVDGNNVSNLILLRKFKLQF